MVMYSVFLVMNDPPSKTHYTSATWVLSNSKYVEVALSHSWTGLKVGVLYGVETWSLDGSVLTIQTGLKVGVLYGVEMAFLQLSENRPIENSHSYPVDGGYY
jgi:hypothetical protein